MPTDRFRLDLPTNNLVTIDRHELDGLRSRERAYVTELERINGVANHIGVLLVLLPNNRGLVQVVNGPAMEVPLPDAVENKKLTFREGDLLRTTDRGQVLGIVEAKRAGTICTVVRALPPGRAEVVVGGQALVLLARAGLELEEGDEVLLDVSKSVVVEVLRKSGASRFEPGEFEPTEWDDVIGQRAAKEALREACVYPYTHPELHQAYGGREMSGVLLWGPPGCGKTMLGRAMATELRRRTGTGKGGFFYAKGPEFLNEFLGKTERAIRELFAAARKRASTEGSSVIFFDEADALLGNRTTNRTMNFEKTVVPTFLTELDGLERKTGVIVLLGTNRPDAIDPAAMRDGRMDYRIEVPRPHGDDIRALFEHHLKGLPLTVGEPMREGDTDVDMRARFFEGAADLLRSTPVFRGAVGEPAVNITVTLERVASGAMVESLVDRAVAFAKARDRAEGRTTASGVGRLDLHQAVQALALEVPAPDLQQAIYEAVEQVRSKPVEPAPEGGGADGSNGAEPRVVLAS